MRRFGIGLASLLVIFYSPLSRAAADADIWSADQEIPATGKTDKRLSQFDRLMTDFLREHQVPGAALAVARNGKIVYARGFGYADVAKKESVDPDALFRI